MKAQPSSSSVFIRGIQTVAAGRVEVGVIIMPPGWNPPTLALAVIVLAFTAVSARVCVLVTEPDPADGGRIKLVLPAIDPCTCTDVRLGGHNAYAPPRPDGTLYIDGPLYIDICHLKDILADGLAKFYHCVATKKDGVSTETPRVTTDAQGATQKAVVSITPELTEPRADCQEILDAGQTTSGVYTIQHAGQKMQVYCRMQPESGKGYIVFQRRLDGSVSFNRTWQEYAEGFGNLTGEFWLGNQKLHSLTGNGGWELVITLRAFDGDEARVRYQNFEIHSHNYWLDVNGFNDESGDAECGISLGMEDGSIHDSAISASSRYTDEDSSRSTDNCQASHGRLNYLGTSGGIIGGWCPSSEPDSWLQVDLGWRLQVEGVIIQGSFDPLETWSEWVTEYQVQYSDDQSNWQYVMQSTGTSPQLQFW
ncbi:fibrinogen beta chain-like [Patiria miniata]|uniref:Fibrinogen C-terminal domain-containing protein n=1 Tax=Patiria miniata TaxID=46514 RepID=A0A914AZH8_PATMI|nr:fibrinogen beta chain-like [Patiria miniata]